MSERAEMLQQPAIQPVLRAKRRLLLRRQRIFGEAAVGAAIPLLVLAAWQYGSSQGWISPVFLPSPLTIIQAGVELTAAGELTRHLGISAGRAAIGFLLGGGLGLLFGLLAGLSRHTEHVLDPSMQMLRMIPHLAIAPLIILWFGFGEVSKILIIAKGAFFPLYIHTLMGIRGVDNKLFDVARVLAFSRRKQIVKLILPAALPQILLGLRLSLALAWLGLVVAELLGSQAGIGFLINVAKQNAVTEHIFVGILIFAIVGKLVDSFVKLLERKWLHWRDSFEG